MMWIITAIRWFMGTPLGRTVALIGGGILAIGLVFHAGRRSGRQDYKAQQAIRFGRAVEEREERKNEIRLISDDALVRRAGKWVRSP